MEKVRGFLAYLGRTYDPILPYLKGIHLMLHGWRPNCDQEGWNINKATLPSRNIQDGYSTDTMEDDDELFLDAYMNEADATSSSKNKCKSSIHKPPKMATAVLRLEEDLCVLNEFFSHSSLPWRIVRGIEIRIVHYRFGDASGQLFGTSFESSAGILFRLGPV